MTLKPETVDLPAHWASYLINGDASGLDEGEAGLIDAGLIRAGLEGASFVSCADEARFTWNYRLFDCGVYDADGGSVLEFTYLTEV